MMGAGSRVKFVVDGVTKALERASKDKNGHVLSKLPQCILLAGQYCAQSRQLSVFIPMCIKVWHNFLNTIIKILIFLLTVYGNKKCTSSSKFWKSSWSYSCKNGSK